MTDTVAVDALLTDTHALPLSCSQFLRVNWLGPRPSYDTTVAVPSCGDGAKGEQAAGPGRLLFNGNAWAAADGDTRVPAHEGIIVGLSNASNMPVTGTHGQSR
jgi:hypothetical protein